MGFSEERDGNKMFRKTPQNAAKWVKIFTKCFTTVLPKWQNGKNLVKKSAGCGKTNQ